MPESYLEGSIGRGIVGAWPEYVALVVLFYLMGHAIANAAHWAWDNWPAAANVDDDNGAADAGGEAADAAALDEAADADVVDDAAALDEAADADADDEEQGGFGDDFTHLPATEIASIGPVASAAKILSVARSTAR